MALSQSELIAKADAICLRLNTDITNSQPVVRRRQDLVSIAQQRAAVEQTALAGLSKLTPPTSIAGDWQQMMADRRTVIEDTIKLGRYARLSDGRGVRSMYMSIAGIQQQIIAIAKRDGFKVCSQLGLPYKP